LLSVVPVITRCVRCCLTVTAAAETSSHPHIIHGIHAAHALKPPVHVHLHRHWVHVHAWHTHHRKVGKSSILHCHHHLHLVEASGSGAEGTHAWKSAAHASRTVEASASSRPVRVRLLFIVAGSLLTFFVRLLGVSRHIGIHFFAT